MGRRLIVVGALVLLTLCLCSAGLANSGEIAAADTTAVEIGEFTDGYAVYYDDGLYGIVRYDGRIVIEPTYQSIGAYGEQLWPVQTEHGWQFVNMDGTTAIAGPYESAGAFKFGVSVISENGLYGTIQSNGAYTIEPVWDYIGEYNSMGVARALTGEQWTLLDAAGNVLTWHMYEGILEYEDAMLGVRNGAYDLLLKDGSVAFTLSADEIGSCANGYITYRVGDTWQLCTSNGEVLWSRIGDGYSYMEPPVNGMARFTTLDSCTLFDVTAGAELYGADWTYASYPSGGIISVMYSNGTYGYVSLDSVPLTETLYEAASDFHYGYALVYDGLKWNIIDDEFNTVATLNGSLAAGFEVTGFSAGYVLAELESGSQIVRVAGSAVESGEFIIENGLLTAYRGEGGAVRIPEGVIAISDDLFRDREDITSICLPESLISIGERAFAMCTNLSGTVYIPGSVREIGDYAFAYTNVEQFEVDPFNSTYLSWDGGLATLDGEFLCYPAGSSDAYYSLPYNAQYLAAYSFAGCEQLRYLNVPYSAAEQLDISSRAFDDNDSTYIICNIDTQAAEAALDMDVPLLTVYTTPEPTPVPTPVPTRAPTPRPTATPEPTNIPGETMVYFNPNGVYYHTHSNCSGMKGAGYYTLDNAIALGKRPCPVCNPPRRTAIPTIIPTQIPHEEPTVIPTAMPTQVPTEMPTSVPTVIPTSVPSPTPEPTDIPGEIMVYFNPNGTYYHTHSNCSGMRGAEYRTLDEAISAGKQPCPVCNPPVPTPEPTPVPTDVPEQLPTNMPTVIPTYVPSGTPEPTAIPGETMVYYNPNGTYYHMTSDCSGMSGAEYHTLDEAVFAGKQPCPVCNPPMSDVEQATQLPEAEETPEATLEPATEPTPEVTTEPTIEATAEPVIEPPMFDAYEDAFAGELTPGVSNRSDVEAVLGAVALSEYEYELDTTLTRVDYAFGYALYNDSGVLERIHVQRSEDGSTEVPAFESVRGITLDSTADDVFAAFYAPYGAVLGEDELIYSDGDMYGAYTAFDSNTGISSIVYTCQIDAENMIQLEYGFADDTMQYMAMSLAEPIVG